MSPFLATIREKWLTITILSLLGMGIWIRVLSYGDMRLSVGMNDTPSYIDSSNAPLFTWNMFTGQRLFTTNLLYKLADNPQECKLTNISLPTKGAVLKLQPCFENIALLQNLLSVFAWCLLAWTTSHWLKNPLTKIVAVVLILAFAFTPQVAEWDGVLSSESLSISLFVLAFALLQEIVFRFSGRVMPLNSVGNLALVIGWVLIFTFWVFMRDAHLSAVPITLALLCTTLLVKNWRLSKIPYFVIAFLLAIFVLGYLSVRASSRAAVPLGDSLRTYIFPYPSRVQFFSNSGMPDPQSPDFQKWLYTQGTKTYALFLITHPGFVVTTVFDRLYYFEFSPIQPYYVSGSLTDRKNFYKAGDFFHPESSSVYLLDALMLVALLAAGLKRTDPWVASWAWLALWLFACASTTLLTNFFGDTAGVARHVVPPEEAIRLSLWIFLIIHMDHLLQHKAPALDAAT